MDIVTNITNQPYKAAVLGLLTTIAVLLAYIVYWMTH